MKNTLPAATLNPREERRLLRGHLWAFRNEFKRLPEDLKDGDIVDVFSDSRRFVGRGYYQTSGGIAVRLLTKHQEAIDSAFFAERFSQAQALRERLFPGERVYRWIYGESDGLPGLVVDRYDSLVVVRGSSPCYAAQAAAIEAACRTAEGVNAVWLDLGGEDTARAEFPESFRFSIDGVAGELYPADAQKTGLFLDQRRNWPVLGKMAAGLRVFDGHCYHGYWACHAALGGALSVTAVDTSQAAIDQAQRNAELNGVADKCHFECISVEESLEKGPTYDIIVLDPPAFAKSRAHTHKALGRYEALNALALKKIADHGGFLITSSCSHFIDAATLLEAVKHAACSTQRRVSLLDLRGAAPDHPVLLAMPETAYLKCLVLRVE